MIFNWKKISEWSLVINEILSERLTSNIKEVIKSDTSDFYDSTNSSWFDNWLPSYPTVPTIDFLSKKVLQYYTKIHSFHACSPKSLNSYFKKGIIPLNPKYFSNQAKTLFVELGLSISEVEKAIADVSTKLREGRIYFSLDDRFLLKYCGHYLIYGSEYFGAIAARLYRNTKIDYRSHLKSISLPTILCCNIPLSNLSKTTIRALAGNILVESIWNIREQRILSSEIDFSFFQSEVIEPSMIISHYHPNTINDPLDRYKDFINTKTHCRWCR